MTFRIETDISKEREDFVCDYHQRPLAKAVAKRSHFPERTVCRIAWEMARIFGLPVGVVAISMVARCPDLAKKVADAIDSEIPF